MSRGDRIIQGALGVGTVLFVWLASYAALAGSEYGQADFSRDDAFTRDELLACWDLGPGLRGDELQGVGDMETWTGAEGGCSDCPTAATCACTPDSDIDSETTFIYKTDTSLKMETDASGNSVYFYYEQTFTANKQYQISVCYKGAAGTEDVFVYIRDAGNTDYYNFATDAWQVGFAAISVTNMPATWSCVAYYVKTGVANKTSYRVYVQEATAGAQVSYFDNFQIKEHYSTIDSDTGYTLAVDVGADPVFGSGQSVFAPNDRGMELDGTDDYLKRVDDDTFDPEGDFSIAARVTKETVAGTRYIASKYQPAGVLRSWAFEFTNDDFYLTISDDGTNVTQTSRLNLGVADVVHSAVATYDWTGTNLEADGAMYIDNNAVNTNTTQRGPPKNVDRNFALGSSSEGAYYLDGELYKVCYWNKALSAIEVNKWLNPYFPGNDNGAGFYVDTCTQAASHATCGYDYCRDGTPHACQASRDTGSMAVFGAYTELIDDNSFETFTGTDDNPTLTHWTQPTGTTMYRADRRHGDVAVKITVPGSSTLLTGSCETASIGSDIYLSAYVKKFSGSGSIGVRMAEYDAANCTTLLSYNTISDHTITDDWDFIGGDFLSGAWDGSTSSYKFILSSSDTVDYLVDTVSVKAASYPTPWVHNLGAGSTAYNLRDYRLYNPLSGHIRSEDKDGYEDGFCFAALMYNDWEADDSVAHVIASVPTTGGTSNVWSLSKTSSDRIQLVLYDGAGTFRYIFSAVTDTNWTAGDWKYVELCSNNTDDLITLVHYNYSNATWYVAPTVYDTGTGIMDDQHAEMHIGHTAGAASLNGYIPNIHIRPYGSPYPEDGFVFGDEVLADTDCEESGTGSWDAINGATLSKVSGSVWNGDLALRVTDTASNYGAARQTSVVTASVDYRISGYARSDGVTAPRVQTGGDAAWTGTTSTNWQHFDVVFTSTSTDVRFYYGGSGGGWCEFDNVSVREFIGHNAPNDPY
jgi:hypothetical protein